MANELTEHFNIPKPNPAHNINDDVVPLGVAFDMVDAALHAQLVALAAKAGAIHGHGIGEIDGLATALAGKMAADETFTLAELTDVVGADTALNNYILTKVDGLYAFRAALSVLGEHGHDIDQVTGLADALALLAPKLNADLTGNPTAPTQAPGNNSTRLANTAFVNAALAPKLAASGGTASNITITSGKEGVAALVTGTSITLDPAVSNLWRIASTGNFNVILPAPVAGVTMSAVFEYGGPHVPTYSGGARKWVDGEIMQPTSVAGKKDRLVITCDDGVAWEMHVAGQNI